MLNKVKKGMPYILGSLIAIILYIVPEAKPLACGLSFPLVQSIMKE